jgi:hypothetical protein
MNLRAVSIFEYPSRPCLCSQRTMSVPCSAMAKTTNSRPLSAWETHFCDDFSINTTQSESIKASRPNWAMGKVKLASLTENFEMRFGFEPPTMDNSGPRQATAMLFNTAAGVESRH